MPKKKTSKKAAFKDRKTGLVIFGIFHIIIGFFCALSIPLMIFGMMAATSLDKNAAPSIGVGQMILVAILYLLLAVWFVWMGIGSILARKWARALILITSWLWLICGLIGFIVILFFIPDIFSPLTVNKELPREVAAIVQSIVTAFLAFIFIVIPGAFVLFYSSRHVKATCEQRDRRPRWTDKAPLPVITLSSVWGCIAISMPLMGFYRWTTPFFGFVLSGIPGAAVVLIYVVLFAYAAWGTYRLQVNAWWCGLLLTIISGMSTGITFLRVGLLELYETMHVPRETIAMIEGLSVFQSSSYLLLWGAAIIGFLMFIIYTKRYFKASAR
jgi:hypothetical protein